MRNNYQSKAVPRGTRTIWRYLGALFLLFTLGIGQMWGVTYTYDFGTASDFSELATTATSGKITMAQTSYTLDASESGAPSRTFTIAISSVANNKSRKVTYKDASNGLNFERCGALAFSLSEPSIVKILVKSKDCEFGKDPYYGTTYTNDTYGNFGSNSTTTLTKGTEVTINCDAGDYKICCSGATGGSYNIKSIKITPAAKVTFDGNGATSGTMQAVYLEKGVAANLPANAFEKTDNDFGGWKDASNNSYTDGQSVTLSASLALTAQWVEPLPRYAITYNKGANGTGSIDAGEKIEGVDFTLSSDMFTRENYLQVGWTKTDGTSREYMLGGTYSTDAAQAFYPAWGEKETYTAAFVYESESPAAPAGWEFSTGDHTASSNSADYVPTFGSAYPSDGPSDDNFIAFGKGGSAYAIYDLGYITTVSKITATLYGGSSSDVSIDIQYLTAKNDATPQYTYTAKANNWATSHTDAVCTEVVPNVRYIKVKGASKWVVMSAFSVTYGSLVTKYDVTFAKGHEDATGTMSTLRYAADVEVTLPDCGFGAPAETKEFDKWVVTKTVGGAGITVTDGKFTMPAEAVTATATWKDKSASYGITEGTHTNGNITIDPASQQDAGKTVTLTATPNEDYLFSAWDVYKTGESSTKVSVTNNTFTMPSYAVTVDATFVADERAKVLYVTSNTADATKANDKLYAALKDTYNVKIVGPTSDADQSTYALVVLHESLNGGEDYNKTAVAAAITGTTPVLNTKSYFYNDGRWAWGTPNAGKTIKGATLNSAYCNIASHPLFSGVTMTDGFFEITDDAVAKCMQPVGSFASGKEGYTLATTPNAESGDGCAIHELTPTQRGASAGKYLMISVLGAKLNALNANGQKLFQNAAAYLIGNTAWEPEAPKTVKHTLTGVTTSSDEEVCAGVAYAATYVAESGYTLPASVTVKAGSTDITANCTWTQATGALTIPALQVTDNIEVVVNGVFNCPEVASGDIVFSWTPKASLADADITAGTYDLPGEWLESVSGGSAEMYVNSDAAMRIRNNQLAFNGNNAYVHLTICALAEGDRILVNSSNETNARNLWISLNTTRPAKAEDAAAVIEQGKAYYISSTSPLKDATDLYIWRASSTTQIGEVSIIRSKKFTVTYAASDLTGGEVPAAVTDIFDGKTITVAGQGTMVKEGMFFNGWKDANEVSYAAGADLEVTANMTLTAQWSQLYTVTYAKAGTEEGTVPTQESLLDGAKFNVADQGSLVTPADKVFGGWNDGSQTYAAGDEYTIAGANVTLTAVWNNNYTVQYDANGGEGTMENGTGSVVTIAANGFTYADHKFLRWNSQPDGEGTNYAVGAEVSESLTLYAIWKEVICPSSGVIYSLAMKTGLANQSVAHGQDLPLTSEYATITGGEATLRNNDGSGDDKAQIYKSEVYFNGANAYLKVDMDCGPLAVGDEIVVTSENYENELYLTNTNNTSEKIETVSRSYTIVANDLLEGKSIFYIWRKSGGTSVGTITITRPAPDAPVPTINNATPADAEYTGAASPMTVSADAEAPKALHYQWYKEAGETDIEVGTDAASYTPTASGQYYCVVTNSPDGYTPKSATSRTATITMISSDATLAWIKAGDVNIALSDGVYAYEYTLPYNYAAAGAPTVTVGTTDANANAEITQAATKTGTATIHVVAQDNVTEKDYSVKFKEFSGCTRAFWFAYADDAATNSVTNNSTIFVSCPTGSSNTGTYTLTIGTDVYTATKNGGSFAASARLVIPSGFNATFYAKVRGSGSNKKITLISTADETVKYSSETFSSSDAQVSIENIPAGTYKLTSDGLSRLYVMAVEMCKYPMEGVSLPATESVLVGQTVTLTPVFDPTNASNKNVTWESDDEDVATVANGVVTGVAAGTANITVTTEDGNFHATCTVTVSELDCDTYLGNLFALTIKDVEATSVSVSTTEIDMSTYATIENGTAFVARTEGSASHKIAYNQSSVIQMQYNTDKLYLKLNLQNCALRAGDMITITGTDDNEFSFTTDATRTTTYKTAGHKYMVQYSDALVGASTIYVWRADNSNTYLKSISIDRGTSIRNLTPGRMGTFTTAYDVNYFAGADFYVPNQIYSIGIEFIEVKELKAGYPYLIVANGDKLFVANEGDAVAEAEDDLQKTRGMVGYLGAGSVDVPNGDDYVVVKNNHLYTAYNNTMKAGYAYFDMTVIRNLTPMDANNSNGAPRRRLTVSYDAPAVVTNIDNIETNDTPMKVMIDGQLFIICGEKMFDATGRLVK